MMQAKNSRTRYILGDKYRGFEVADGDDKGLEDAGDKPETLEEVG